MKDVVHIIGHKNPDTDSIVSAIAYAQLKQKLGINAIACRLGELNPETDFVLKKFQVPEPVYIQNARVKLYDVPFDEPLLLKKDDTIKEAWDRMGMRSTSALFVVDEAQKLIGVVSLSDMTNILMSDKGEKPISLMKNTSCENIRKVLQGEFLYECDAYRTNGRIHILCSRNAEYSDISYRDSIVVVNDDLKLQKRALSDGAGCMILVDVDIISQGIIRMAKEANCTIIKTPLNMFQVARSMYRSPSVKLIMKRKIISFNNHAYIDDVYKQMSKSRFRSYPVVNNQGVVLGSISRYHLLNYQKKKFILVDHNELSQSIDDLKEAEILEVVDHLQIIPAEKVQLDVVGGIVGASIDQNVVGSSLIGGQATDAAGQGGGIVARVADIGTQEGIVLQKLSPHFLNGLHPPSSLHRVKAGVGNVAGRIKAGHHGGVGCEGADAVP